MNLFKLSTIKLVVIGGSLFFGLPSYAMVVPGFFKGKIETISGCSSDHSKAGVKVFIKTIQTQTPMGYEQNYYGFITVDIDESNYEIQYSGLFNIEEITPGYQVWTRMINLGERSIVRDAVPSFEVREFLENGDLKIRFSAINHDDLLLGYDGAHTDECHSTTFLAESNKSEQWIDVPQKTIKLDKTKEVEGRINSNYLVGQFPVYELKTKTNEEGHVFMVNESVNYSGNYSLSKVFTGTNFLIEQKPNSKSRKGYEENKTPVALLVSVKDCGDYKFYIYKNSDKSGILKPTTVLKED